MMMVMMLVEVIVFVVEGKGCAVVMPEKYVYRRIEWYCWWIVAPSGEKERGKRGQLG